MLKRHDSLDKLRLVPLDTVALLHEQINSAYNSLSGACRIFLNQIDSI